MNIRNNIRIDRYINMADLRYAFTKTIPILFSYMLLSLAFGIMMQQAGYNFLWAYFASAFIYTGAFQFVLVPLLSAGVSLVTVTLIAAAMNSRHIFYGISYVDTFKKMGKRYPYMIFSLTDETYSLYCSEDYKGCVNKENVMFYIAVLCRVYWIFGSIIGALLGQNIPFDFKGVDFCMTALFVTIFIDQWKSAKSHIPALVGLCSAIVFLIVLGSDHFIVPSLICTTGILLVISYIDMQRAGGLEDEY